MLPSPVTLLVVLVLGLVMAGVAGCGDDDSSDRQLDSTPTKLDGSESQEFEAEDLEQAERASQAVKDYCAGAVSEAQELGCLSHVDESDIP